MKKLQALSFAIALVGAGNAVASSSTWDFTSGGTYSGGSSSYSYGNSILFSSNTGSTVTVTAWSDTEEQAGYDKIETAAAKYNSYGLLNYNQNRYTEYSNFRYESNGYYYRDRRHASDGHTIDNSSDYESCTTQYQSGSNWYTSGVYSCAGQNLDDTDFVLLTFSDAVSLSGLSLGWPTSSTSSVSIGALSNASVPSIGGSTWASVASGLLFKESFNNVGSAYSLTSNSSNGISTIFSKYWLVGAYNSLFGSLINPDHSAFKLAGLTTHGRTPSNASAPGAAAVLLLGGLFMWARRRKAG